MRAYVLGTGVGADDRNTIERIAGTAALMTKNEVFAAMDQALHNTVAYEHS